MEQFHFSYWPIHTVNNIWDTYVKDHHDLGLTILVTPAFSEGDDPAKLIRILDECQEYGMKAIIKDKRVEADRKLEIWDAEAWKVRFKKSLEDFSSHPAVIGYFVGDEPGASMAPQFFGIARLMREMAPDLLPYINLLPWYDWDWLKKLLGFDSYGPYLDYAVKEGNLKLLSYDCYANMQEGDIGWNDYFYNLHEMRDAANRNGIPFQSIVLACGLNENRCPNRDDMRWQISTAAAMGAKMISYFLVDPGDMSDNYYGMAINRYYERTPTFAAIADETRDFREKFGALMMKLTCKKSEFTLKAYGSLKLFEPDETLRRVRTDKITNVLVSTFTDGEGTTYRAFVNLDLTKNVKLLLDYAPGICVERMHWNNTWLDCSSYAGEASAEMWMTPGQLHVIRETKK